MIFEHQRGFYPTREARHKAKVRAALQAYLYITAQAFTDTDGNTVRKPNDIDIQRCCTAVDLDVNDHDALVNWLIELSLHVGRCTRMQIEQTEKAIKSKVTSLTMLMDNLPEGMETLLLRFTPSKGVDTDKVKKSLYWCSPEALKTFGLTGESSRFQSHVVFDKSQSMYMRNFVELIQETTIALHTNNVVKRHLGESIVKWATRQGIIGKLELPHDEEKGQYNSYKAAVLSTAGGKTMVGR